MIPLTDEQVMATAETSSPLQVLNPKTREVYVLIRKEVYDLTRSIVGGGPGQVWDDAADDELIRK
jgi:hypothetical protein